MTTIASLRILLGLDSGGVKTGANSVSADLRGVQKQAAVTNTALMQVGAGLKAGIGLGAGLGTFQLAAAGVREASQALGDAVDNARDLTETVNKSKVVFGPAAAQIEAFGKSAASNLGLSKNAAIGAAATFGNLFVSLGLGADKVAPMSQALVALAGDLASFNNISVNEALEKLQAGIVGEARPLRELGVAINEAAVNAEAARLGFQALAGQFTESEKVQARYNLILKLTGTAQGDFARTSNDLANQQRKNSAALENVSATAGRVLIPVFTSLAGILNTAVIPALQVVADNMGAILPVVEGVAAVLAARLAVSLALSAANFALATAAALGFGTATGVAAAGATAAAVATTAAAVQTELFSAAALAGAPQLELFAAAELSAAGGATAVATASTGAAAGVGSAAASARLALGPFAALATAGVVGGIALHEVFKAGWQVSDALAHIINPSLGVKGATTEMGAALQKSARDSLLATEHAEILSASYGSLGEQSIALEHELDLVLGGVGLVPTRFNAAGKSAQALLFDVDALTAGMVNLGAVFRTMPTINIGGENIELNTYEENAALFLKGLHDQQTARDKAAADELERLRKLKQLQADAAADAKRHAAEVASAYRERLGDAFDAVKRKAHEFFDDLHQRNLDAIQDVHDRANAELDEQQRAIRGAVDAERARVAAIRTRRQETTLRANVIEATNPEDLARAQQALNDFLDDQRLAFLGGQADTQIAALEAQKAANDKLAAEAVAAENERNQAQVAAFDFQLAALQKKLSEHPKAWASTQQDILKLLMAFGVDYKKAGENLGKQFAAGLLSSTRAAEDAAAALVAAAGGPLGVKPPEPGGAVPPVAAPPVIGVPPSAAVAAGLAPREIVIHTHLHLGPDEIVEVIERAQFNAEGIYNPTPVSTGSQR